MGKIRPGNSENSKLNREWGKHIRRFWKRFTSGKRRSMDKIIIREELRNNEN